MFSKIISIASVAIGSAIAGYSPSSYQLNVDNSTYANADSIHTTHYHVDWDVDFTASQLFGSITHDLKVLQDTQTLVLDSWKINIESIELLPAFSAVAQMNAGINQLSISGESLNWEINEVNPIIGDALVISFNELQTKGDVSVRIWYSTQPSAQAFSWMEPSQTAGGVLPYMFTQCEDINCRTVAPLQDTPSNRVTYSARVVTLKELVVKMSANETGLAALNATHNVATFHCAIPIPSYLMAVAIGDLVYRSLGRRVGVITEPSQIDFVANELEDMELLLDTTEAYIGDYIWGNYTIIVLPPSFPMGGMENPLLTFASPTIIVGDKSQVYVATHEMAHSWTGNTITCRDWESFWLNEGFTVFIERKVSGELYGEDFALVEAQLGNTSLWNDMVAYGLDTTYSSIHPVLAGDNPDNSFSELPYERGFQTLVYLESLVGSDQIRSFLRYYVQKNFLTSITYVELQRTWAQWVEENYSQTETNRILAATNWNFWIFESKLPPAGLLDFSTPEATEAASLALAYIELQGEASPANYKDYFAFYSNLKVIFYTTLLENIDQVTIALLERIDADYATTADPDPEVKQRWLPMGLTLFYTPAYDAAHTWVSSVGRCKYLTSVYSALQSSGQHDLGVEWYNENLDFYHPVAITTEAHVLGLDSIAAFIQ